MAFPQVASSAQILETTDVTSHDIPAVTASNNDLALIVVGFNGAPTLSTDPTGSTKIVDSANGTASKMGVWWKRLAGNEPARTIITGTAEQSAGRIYVISGAHTSTAPEASAGAGGATVNPDPGALNPANWDIEDTLWFALHNGPHGTRTITTWPANYTANQNYDKTNTTTTGACLASCTRQNAVASEDPGAWTISNSMAWRAHTIAIRPAAAAVQPIRLVGMVGVRGAA